MNCIVHISDLHFGREIPTVMEGLLNCLQALRPDLIIISGDLTQRARHREFEAAVSFLQTLPRPCLVVPGNHDISAHNLPERFFSPWDKWRKYICAELEPVYSQPGMTAVSINTARRMGFYLDWSRGRINRRQSHKVRKIFTDESPEQLRIVVAHHPFWLPQSSLKRNLVGRCDAALPLFQQAGVDVIMGGHIHLAYVEPVQGMIVSHAGTTISHRLIDGQPNSFNLLKGDRRELEIEQWEWGGRSFTAGMSQTFQRGERGWQLK